MADYSWRSTVNCEGWCFFVFVFWHTSHLHVSDLSSTVETISNGVPVIVGIPLILPMFCCFIDGWMVGLPCMAGLSGHVRRSARRCGPSCQACLGSKDRKDKNDGETGESCGFSWDFVGFHGNLPDFNFNGIVLDFRPAPNPFWATGNKQQPWWNDGWMWIEHVIINDFVKQHHVFLVAMLTGCLAFFSVIYV